MQGTRGKGGSGGRKGGGSGGGKKPQKAHSGGIAKKSIKCLRCRGVGHTAKICPTPKPIKVKAEKTKEDAANAAAEDRGEGNEEIELKARGNEMGNRDIKEEKDDDKGITGSK